MVANWFPIFSFDVLDRPLMLQLHADLVREKVIDIRIEDRQNDATATRSNGDQINSSECC